MPPALRSHLAVALAAAAIAFIAVTGLHPASADETSGRAVVGDDFYSRTRTDQCDEFLAGFCWMPSLEVNCKPGDTVLGGTGWAVQSGGGIVSLAEVGMFDIPYRSRGWQVRNSGLDYENDLLIRVRVFCADTG